MSNITWLDEDMPSRKRAKVTYECCALNGERKRKSKTFKAGTPLREIKAFQRKVEQEYESSEGMDYSKRLLKDFLFEDVSDKLCKLFLKYCPLKLLRSYP